MWATHSQPMQHRTHSHTSPHLTNTVVLRRLSDPSCRPGRSTTYVARLCSGTIGNIVILKKDLDSWENLLLGGAPSTVMCKFSSPKKGSKCKKNDHNVGLVADSHTLTSDSSLVNTGYSAPFWPWFSEGLHPATMSVFRVLLIASTVAPNEAPVKVSASYVFWVVCNKA